MVREDRSWWRIALVAVPLIVIAGSASGLLSNSGSDNAWYAPLAKPSFQPPGWAFGVVWTTLYALMGIALALVADGRALHGQTLHVTTPKGFALARVTDPVFVDPEGKRVHA